MFWGKFEMFQKWLEGPIVEDLTLSADYEKFPWRKI